MPQLYFSCNELFAYKQFWDMAYWCLYHKVYLKIAVYIDGCRGVDS